MTEGYVFDKWNRRRATLRLADGTTFQGYSFGYPCNTAGEICFNTGMVGYPESLTDPSYCGQVLMFTYPLIGNYGVPNPESISFDTVKENLESNQIQLRAVVCCQYSSNPSHHANEMTMGEWLYGSKIPAICGIDTRAVTRHIRTYGAQMVSIEIDGCTEKPLYSIKDDPNLSNLVDMMSRKHVTELKNYTTFDPAKGPHRRLVVVDCGIKNNIIRLFLNRSPDDVQLDLIVVPWNHKFADMKVDGLFLSNGPGDPAILTPLIDQIKLFMERRLPIFGICLGNQLLAIAAGAKTYKMKFGHRGMNQPVMDLRTMRCYISSQNHGYAVDNDSLKENWMPLFVNVNDRTNEGIFHSNQPWTAVQFHPEASAGPTDTSFLFHDFIEVVKDPAFRRTYSVPFNFPIKPTKVLVLGSGGLSIGQAGEFDYSGSQALKALRECNCRTVVVNPNIATVQTSQGMADKVYFLPVTPEFVKKIIIKERPDGIVCSFGGQTGLNCAVSLYEEGFLQEHNIQVLGTPIESIIATEDREIFSEKLASINESCAPSLCANTMEEARKAANEIGYPILLRGAFCLGGLGSGFCENDAELEVLCKEALAMTPQVIIDKSLRGWKEVEYEVVRDINGNVITVCNMENFDPLGIHTGDSIVVAPSQTLSNADYYMLRDCALKVIESLKIVGECNIQFALNPDKKEYFIVEVNARLSRSSALASKATGYPLAYVAAYLALHYDLPTLRNKVTRETTACFEPALDYVVTKVPRWDLGKFDHVSSEMGSSMKSVGEVMGIGRTFEESLQKALRMVTDSEIQGFECPPDKDTWKDDKALEKEMTHPSPNRIWALAKALRQGYSVDRLHELTKIDKWFLNCLNNINTLEKKALTLSQENLDRDSLLLFKQYGFSDRRIAQYIEGSTPDSIRSLRLMYNIRPFMKLIDTVAGEFAACTNYLYSTYHAVEHDVSPLRINKPPITPPTSTLTRANNGATRNFNVSKKEDPGSASLETGEIVIVLGCGCYRIGSSVEFDWSSMSAVKTLTNLGYKPIVINCNPETVSTDFDESDRLFFEEISYETVMDICEFENPGGVIVSVGGQSPNNLAIKLSESNVNVLGTPADSIDRAEDRNKFSALCDEIGVDQPRWSMFGELNEAYSFCKEVGYPVLVRPSYVLSGAAMRVVWFESDLAKLLSGATIVSPDHPVVISKYIEGAKEVEMDAVACNGNIINYAISEHVENAGVHSGDATLVLPAQNLYAETIRRVRRISQKIASALKISGPFNIQFMSKRNDVKVIECNLRASRTFPFISKTFNVNFIELATKIMVGVPVKPINIQLMDIDYVGVKCPMFSFTRLRGADPRLGVEMRSTGEVACFGAHKHEAFLKAWISTNSTVPTKGIMLSVGPDKAKIEMLQWVTAFNARKFPIYATPTTYEFIVERLADKIDMQYVKLCAKPGDKVPEGTADAVRLIETKTVDMLINVPRMSRLDDSSFTAGFHVRRAASNVQCPLITDVKLGTMFVDSVERMIYRESKGKRFWEVKSMDEYINSL